MVHAFALELLWPFSRPEDRHRFPCFDHRDHPDHQRPVFPKGCLVRDLSSWSFLVLATSSETVHHSFVSPSGSLQLTLDLHNPASLTNEPMIYTSTTGSTQLSMAKLTFQGHVRIAFFRFPLPNLC
jgi:hypothetical protein